MHIDSPIRILVADDHRIVRDGLRLILESQEEFALAGEAANGEEAVRMAAELHPDVILMDLRMPRMDGIAAIEAIHTQDHVEQIAWIEIPRLAIGIERNGAFDARINLDIDLELLRELIDDFGKRGAI